MLKDSQFCCLFCLYQKTQQFHSQNEAASPGLLTRGVGLWLFSSEMRGNNEHFQEQLPCLMLFFLMLCSVVVRKLYSWFLAQQQQQLTVLSQMLSHPTHTLTETTQEAEDSVKNMGLVVQEKREGGAPDELVDMKGEEAGVTEIWEKSLVGHILERDEGQDFQCSGYVWKAERIGQKNS